MINETDETRFFGSAKDLVENLYAICPSDICMYKFIYMFRKTPINLFIRTCILIKWRYIQFAPKHLIISVLLKLYL